MLPDASDLWGFTPAELSPEWTGRKITRSSEPNYYVTPHVYVLHFEPAIHHARHYIGIAWDGNVARRLQEHASGRGSALVFAAYAAGCRVTITADRPGDLGLERRMHNRHGTRVCPVCVPRLRYLG
jgi:hypothetical protein